MHLAVARRPLSSVTPRWLERILAVSVLPACGCSCSGITHACYHSTPASIRQEHLKYIELHPGTPALPLPTEGLEMYQPPLYYLIGAGSSFSMQTVDQRSRVGGRSAFAGGFFGIAQFVLVFLSLRLLLPARTAFIGLLLAAFLPMHLYLAHYVTNEMLAATLATAGALSLFASAEERGAARIAVCLAWSWRLARRCWRR